VAVKDGQPMGDAAHPANFGKLCSKGSALKDTLGLPDRLTVPMVHGKESDWDSALDLIATEFTRVIAAHGPQAVAFYVSGQLLTEDYYVSNKLMKGFIGAGNIDTNSRLCMASSVAGHVRAFGEDVVPGCYEDLDEADLIVLVGSNAAWCHPILFQRIVAAREKRGTKIVVIDPRRTASAEMADLHLPIAAGSDISIFTELLVYLSAHEALDRGWIERHVTGFSETLAAATSAAPSAEAVAVAAGLSPQDLQLFYEMFAKTERVVTLYSQGVNQSYFGTDKVNAILNCHLATGRIGRPGMGPFSLTGQPNAMGGREVGGLANQLAAHMTFNTEDLDRVRRFWKAPRLAEKPGLKAVELFDAVADGRVKAIWIAATNPADSMPRASHVRAALEKCPFVVVADAWPTDTSKLAHVVLPAASWSEKDGTVTNSERRISRVRAFRAAPGMARPDWWMFAEVARRMGWENEFPYAGPADIFREHAALSAFENNGKRVFNLGALTDFSDEDYDTMAPVQWPCAQPGTNTLYSGPRLFARGGFSTPDGKARMVAPEQVSESGDPRFPLKLNTGRIRDQWHTMTRTGRVPHLMNHTSEPLIAMHPGDAQAFGLTEGALAHVESVHGKTILKVSTTEAQRPGEIFVPMHWTDQFSSAGPIDRLVSSRTDKFSGQPDLKGTWVNLKPVGEKWTGLLLRRAPAQPELGEKVYWSKAPVEKGYAFDLAGWQALESVIASESILRNLLQIPREAELISYSDPKKFVFRYAGLMAGKLEACVFFAPPANDLPERELAARWLGREMDARERLSLLAAHEPDGQMQAGKIVCACFAVGEKTLSNVIRDKNLRTPAEIGAACKAGTNCGSCIPELKKLLAVSQADGLALAG
jgi:assimilatory nitrate reductase catalytic subunit